MLPPFWQNKPKFYNHFKVGYAAGIEFIDENGGGPGVPTPRAPTREGMAGRGSGSPFPSTLDVVSRNRTEVISRRRRAAPTPP